jgi:hypothetical protein
LRPTPYTLRLLPPLCSLPPDPRPLLPGPCFSLASPPLLLYHNNTHRNTPSVPLSRADDDSHGPGGAVSMSAHSNHTSTPSLLTTHDCSLPPLAKGGAGDLGLAGRIPVVPPFSRRGGIRRWSFGVHCSQCFGHKDVKAIMIYTHVSNPGGREVWTSMDALREMGLWHPMPKGSWAGGLIWKPHNP